VYHLRRCRCPWRVSAGPRPGDPGSIGGVRTRPSGRQVGRRETLRVLLDQIQTPADLRRLDRSEPEQPAPEIRGVLIDAVAANGGHLGSNLGSVELTLALHRVFESPRDAIVWDTGHQAYVHKLVTGRRDGFVRLRQAGGLSGYPSRAESEHD